MAAKYKLYKKLSKASAAQSSSAHTSLDSPSTPPRSRPRSHTLGQSRFVETTAPLSSFNPFSPQKNKGKEKASQPRPHHSSSPFKSKRPPNDPFPLINPDKPSTSSHTPPRSPTVPSSALSRARKRLRGDPVSPSPNKEKRRRVGSQSILPFPKFAPSLSESSDDEETPEGNSSFIISDSPMKAPSGAKSFRLLFDESTESKGGPVNGKPIARRSRKSTSLGLFGISSVSGTEEEEALWDDSDKHKSPLIKLASNETARPPDVKVILARKTAKRPLNDSDAEDMDVAQQSSFAPSVLIPPSPPPAECSKNFQKRNYSANRKGKVEPNKRKKAKTIGNEVDDPEESTDDSDILSTKVKIIKRTQTFLHSQPLISANEDLELDPILGHSIRDAHARHETQPSLDEQEGRLEFDLPDKLRSVLALDKTELKARYLHEERVVKSLVLGQRLGHYDHTKGGEIWDVGENDVIASKEEGTWKDIDGEDDWEGEPVPWETGEL
ncbi:hypothetical protein C0992_013126 [Termitomyces sp. T32_za158]|nr:hypothetical protein C0992_013126 [Termitomyces sp. T32_za158]